MYRFLLGQLETQCGAAAIATLLWKAPERSDCRKNPVMAQA